MYNASVEHYTSRAIEDHKYNSRGELNGKEGSVRKV